MSALTQSSAKHFISRLKTLDKKIGRQYLLDFTGVNRQTMSGWLLGKRTPAPDSIQQTEKALRDSFMDLNMLHEALNEALPALVYCKRI